jgi:hypothetical protein
MKKRFKKFLLLIFLVFPIQISVPAYSSSDDWSSCVDDLQSLKSASSDASEAAARAESERQQFDQKSKELQDCIDDIDISDFMNDNCQSLKWENESKKSNYQKALNHLRDELFSLGIVIKAVEFSCEYTLTDVIRGALKTTSKPEADCKVFSSLIGKVRYCQFNCVKF